MTTRSSILKLVVSSWLVFCSSNSLFAGTGIKGGFSLTGLHSATGDFRHFLGYEMEWLSMGNRAGFQIGVFHEWDLSRILALQPEAYFSVRGGDASADFDFGEIVSRTTIRYLELPLLLELKIPPLEGRLRPSVFVGPYGALKLSAHKYTVVGGREERVELENVNTVDYGFVVGGSVALDVGSGQLIFDLRSSLGLNDVMTMPDAYISLYEEKDKIRTFAFSLMVGYKF